MRSAHVASMSVVFVMMMTCCFHDLGSLFSWLTLIYIQRHCLATSQEQGYGEVIYISFVSTYKSTCVTHMLRHLLTYVLHIYCICFTYVSHMFYICPTNIGYTYVLHMFRHSPHMYKQMFLHMFFHMFICLVATLLVCLWHRFFLRLFGW